MASFRSNYYVVDTINIQNLFKNHRLGRKNADKVLDIVVTSVLATLPDRASESMIQFISEHSPANWYTSLEKHLTKDIFIEKFDEKVLKDIMMG